MNIVVTQPKPRETSEGPYVRPQPGRHAPNGPNANPLNPGGIVKLPGRRAGIALGARLTIKALEYLATNRNDYQSLDAVQRDEWILAIETFAGVEEAKELQGQLYQHGYYAQESWQRLLDGKIVITIGPVHNRLQSDVEFDRLAKIARSFQRTSELTLLQL